MGRDPKYEGKFGIPDFIINTPQKPAQWWLVALLALLIVLPFGLWSILEDIGNVAIAGYAVLVVASGLTAWALRNDINETMPYLSFAFIVAIALLAATIYLVAFQVAPEEQWVAVALLVGTGLVALHNLYRAWQTMLIVGLFTEQPVPPDSPYYKHPV